MPVRPPTFRPQGQRTRTEVRRDYDTRRGSARDRGYDARWDRDAASFKRAHPLCLGCQAVGVIRATEIVDHTNPHKGDPIKFRDPLNRQPSCKWHHDVVKQQLEAMFDRGEIEVEGLRLDSKAAIELTQRLQRTF